MADRKTRISELAIRIAAQFNTARTERGLLTGLSTTNKSNLVSAVNELKGLIDTIEITGVIDDTKAAATNRTWSIDKIKVELQSVVDGLIGGAPGAFDTLKELADELSASDGSINTILTAQAKRVKVDGAQSFTTAEKNQARVNIDAASGTDVGDTNHNFVAEFEAALT